MDDWFVNVLISVRDMAAKNGMIALAEEMDIAILVAANEGHEREMADLGKADVRSTEHSPGEAARVAGTEVVRRYH